MAQVDREVAAAGSRIATPETWARHGGDRWVIHADDHVEAPLAFAEAVAAGLEQHPRVLPYRYLYDARGSDIYERITEQSEYYPTRVEERILEQHAVAIREIAGNTTLVEFGSGSSRKTRHLLDAWTARGSARYVPIDVSESALRGACEALTAEYPDLQIEALATTYARSMPLLPAVSPSTFVFMGSSIGNFDNEEIDRFFERVAASLAPGDAFVLGIDLVKDAEVLEAAYNDDAGWSAAFTRNLFARMNRELGTEIPLDAVEHVAYWNEALERIEIYGRFKRAVQIDLESIGRSFRVAPGEMVRTEISRKFRAGAMAATAARFGLQQAGAFTDPSERFAVLVLRRGSEMRIPADRADGIRRRLARVRARTLGIVGPLAEADLAACPSEIMGPILWDLGHIADFERLWLVEMLDRGGVDAGLDEVFDPDANPRSSRGELNLPSRQEIETRLRLVRERVLARLRGGLDEGGPLTAQGYVYNMVAQHESQHQETMLQGIQQREDIRYSPRLDGSSPRRPDAQLAGESVLIPAGECTIGTHDRSSAYDNERPAHTVALRAYRIDVTPVTNGQYREFIDDAGYARADLWTEAGWDLRQRDSWEAPLYWHRHGEEWCRKVFGQCRPLDPERPVVHVSWYEAQAYARWSGKRLPTEQEWEKAAAWDGSRGAARRYPWGAARPDSPYANLGQEIYEPVAVGSYPAGRSFYGCHQMLGDVFEWTDSEFRPYPGFEAFPYAEYSEVFFGDKYRVLRGASWATPRFMARNTYRNWDLPERRHIFAGFRCAEDA